MESESIEVENDNAAPVDKKPRKRTPLVNTAVKEETVITTDEKPKRTYNKRGKKSAAMDILTPESIANLAKQIEGLHILGAQISGIPEIMLSSADSQALATSVLAVCSQYDLSIDGKTGALLQLLGTVSIIYVPRFFAFKKRTTENTVIENAV